MKPSIHKESTGSDYYPFGMQMPDRNFTTENYRFGFNGKEKDDEAKPEGKGNELDYGARIYDTRLGKFLSVDPLLKSYPMLTPYQFASNSVIAAIDLDGFEAKLSIYGAGIEVDIEGKVRGRHETTFKIESDRDVAVGNSTISLGIHVGRQLVNTLEYYTKKEGSIEYLSISSHCMSSGLLLDNGQYGLEFVGTPKKRDLTNSNKQPYTFTDIDAIAKNPKIKFTENALVIFSGCDGGKTKSRVNGSAVYSVAEDFTDKTGVATIGAVGETSPSGENGARKADYEYRLFYKNEDNELRHISLGQELNQDVINRAKEIINGVIEKKKANCSSTPPSK